MRLQRQTRRKHFRRAVREIVRTTSGDSKSFRRVKPDALDGRAIAVANNYSGPIPVTLASIPRSPTLSEDLKRPCPKRSPQFARRFSVLILTYARLSISSRHFEDEVESNIHTESVDEV